MNRICWSLPLALIACDPADSSPPVAPVTAVSATPIQSSAPTASAPAELPTLQDSHVMNITLLANGTAEIEGKSVPSDDAILTVANTAVAENPSVAAVINADATVPHARVIHVLDLLKQAKVNKMSFGTKPAN